MNLRRLLSFRLACAALLALGTVVCGCSTAGSGSAAQASPAASALPVAASAAAPPEPRSAFDGERAFADLKKQVAFGPRVPEMPGHAATQAWILAELKKTGAEVGTQDFIWTLPDGKKLPMSNLYARFNPDAKKQVLLCAHWDTRPSADQEIDPAKQKKPIPGADDGASGVAVLMELARVFAAKKPDVGVELVFFDGEDYGPSEDRMYLGAREWAKHPPLPQPEFGILIDMIGNIGVSIPREKNSDLVAPEVNDKIWAAASTLGYLEFGTQPGLMVDDDHIPLEKIGWKVVDLIDFNYGPWHTLDDTPDKCSPDSLKAVGDVLAKVTYDER